MRFIEWLIAGASALMVQAVARLMQERGGAVAYKTLLFTNYDVNKYPPDARDRHGREVPVYFEAVMEAVAAIGDTYDLFTIPKGWAVKDFYLITDGLGATVTGTVGDTADPDRLMQSVSLATAELKGALAFAGSNFRPTADTIVRLTTAVAAPTVAKIAKGFVTLVPGS